MIALDSVRRQYPITKHGVFLNHAATSSVSAATIRRIEETARQMAEPLGKHFYNALGAIEETRRLLAELVNGHPSEIAFTQNTSTALSLLAQAVRFKRGDRVLVPADEFPSNLFVWQNLEKKGVKCIPVELERDVPLLETLAKHDLAKVKLIALSAVSYRTGRTHDLKAFADFCRKHEIISCVDAIQAIGAIPFDVRATGIDLMASGAQKWILGPIGCGFLYARKEMLEELDVPLAGWTSVKYPENFALKELDFSGEMTRFEPGLPNLLSIAGLNESLRELAKVGWTEIFTAVRANARYLEDALAAQKIETMAGAEGQAGIVSFFLPSGMDARETGARLEHKGINVTLREGYIRASPHFYTTKDELDTFLKVFGATRAQVVVPKEMAPTPKAEKTSEKPHVLLTGCTGILGGHLARELASRGFTLTLVARDEKKVAALAKEVKKKFGVVVEEEAADFTKSKEVDALVARLKKGKHKFFALINAAGSVETEPFATLEDEALEAMFQVNVFAPAKLTRAFLNGLRAEKAIGVMNFVSSAARCGAPLLAGYGASNAALWTLGETIDREVHGEGLVLTTFVASQMHSRMQKRIGRVALRYFQMSGQFDYDHADLVAKEAVDALLARKRFVISRANRLMVVANALFPDYISGKIEKVWKK